MHLVIFFCGTGNEGKSFTDTYDYANANPEVRTILVEGCDHPEVCNSILFPNLKNYAQRFVTGLFKKNEQTMQLTTTDLQNLHLGIRTQDVLKKDKQDKDVTYRKTTDVGSIDDQKEITSITLCGYSRGAVTCFEVARQLNRIAPNIPIDIVADQPVPGNSYQFPGSNAANIADCRDLTNVKNVSIILGAYTGAQEFFDVHVLSKMPSNLASYKNSLIFCNGGLHHVNSAGISNLLSSNTSYNNIAILQHFKIIDQNGAIIPGKKSFPSSCLGYFLNSESSNEIENSDVFYETTDPAHTHFFSQIVPRLPNTANVTTTITPRESHHAVRVNSPGEEQAHLHMGVAQSLARKGLIGEAVVKAKTENAKALYSATEGRAANYFPPASQLQKTFGLSNSNYSLFKDPLHPAPLTRGYVFRPNETLEAWWNRQELKASRFSTQLTKDLVNVLKNTDINDSNKLKELYKQADLWLIHKQGQSTSRYNQVEALRNNIYHRLQQPEFGITRRELAEINRTNLKDTDYFLNYWIQGSKAASYYSTPETKELEQAIFTHSGQEPTKESDLALLQKMDEWLGKKQTSSSKRYDLVNSMRVHLQRVIEETYAIKLENVDGVTHEVAQDDSSSQFIL